MKRRLIGYVTMFVIIFSFSLLIDHAVEAKTYKSLTNGGYYSTFKSAKISDGKLVVKGTVTDWERSYNTKSYKKSGTHKLKLSKNYDIMDGYKPSYYISKKKFNKLCKKKDSLHKSIAFMVENKKVTLVRFW